MKKKIISILLAAAMTASALGGCGSEGGERTGAATESSAGKNETMVTEDSAGERAGAAMESSDGKNTEAGTENSDEKNASVTENSAGKSTAAETGNLQNVSGTAMGRYVESEVFLPEKVTVQALMSTADGKLRIAGQTNEGQMALWESGDGGVTWEQTLTLPEYTDQYFISLALASDGGGAGTIMEDVGDASSHSMKYVSFDAEGNTKETELGEMGTDATKKMYSQLAFGQNGELIGNCFGGGAVLLDRDTGAITAQLCDSGAMLVGSWGQDALVMMEGTELQLYDITSGEPKPRDEALNEALAADGMSYYQTTSSGYPIIFTADTDGRLYYCNQKGIFAHMQDGSAVEQVVDAGLNSLSDPSVTLMKMALVGQSFYVLYMGGEGKTGLMKFEYDPDVSSVPEQELAIYSLRESDGIRQVITKFQNMYPDVYVNYHTGISENSGVTVSDALRTLNTDILAGNGPDILLLDGMSVDTYEGKGLLMDLSEIYKEVKDTDGMLENIAGAYQRENGIFAIPAKFCIPVAGGEKELIGNLENLQSLVEVAGSGGAVSAGDMLFLPSVLYPVCAGSWKKEDHTIDQERLAEFVGSMKQIYDAWCENAPKEALELMEQLKTGVTDWTNLSSSYLNEMSLLSGEAKVSFAEIGDMIAYSAISSVNLQNNNAGIELLKGQQSGVYCPVSVLSILNTAKEPELAKQFVKYVLSKEGELGNQGMGYPVNAQAFRDTLYQPAFEDGTWSSSSENNQTGEMIELVYSWPTTEELDKLTEMVKSLNVCADTDGVAREAVLDNVYACMMGEISEEEAVNSIMQTINLYLAE